MSITHHTYFDGAVQSLEFDFGKISYTVGVVMPGEYDFGQAERRETIRVITGILVINDQAYAPHQLIGLDVKDGSCVIQVGERIHIMAEIPVSYFCSFR